MIAAARVQFAHRYEHRGPDVDSIETRHKRVLEGQVEVAVVNALDVRLNQRAVDGDLHPIEGIASREGVDAKPDRARQSFAEAIDLATTAFAEPGETILGVVKAHSAGDFGDRGPRPENDAQNRTRVPIAAA